MLGQLGLVKLQQVHQALAMRGQLSHRHIVEGRHISQASWLLLGIGCAATGFSSCMHKRQLDALTRAKDGQRPQQWDLESRENMLVAVTIYKLLKYRVRTSSTDLSYKVFRNCHKTQAMLLNRNASVWQ